MERKYVVGQRMADGVVWPVAKDGMRLLTLAEAIETKGDLIAGGVREKDVVIGEASL